MDLAAPATFVAKPYVLTRGAQRLFGDAELAASVDPAAPAATIASSGHEAARSTRAGLHLLHLSMQRVPAGLEEAVRRLETEPSSAVAREELRSALAGKAGKRSPLPSAEFAHPSDEVRAHGARRLARAASELLDAGTDAGPAVAASVGRVDRAAVVAAEMHSRAAAVLLAPAHDPAVGAAARQAYDTALDLQYSRAAAVALQHEGVAVGDASHQLAQLQRALLA